MAYCTKCGTQVAEGVKFCTSCDALLDAYRSRYRRYHRLGGRYALR